MLAGRFEESIRVGAEALPLVEQLGMADQCARVHIVVGCDRCCLGDLSGLDEIETGIRTAEAAGSAEMVVNGYLNLNAELHFFARLPEARRALRQGLKLAERYGLSPYLHGARQELAAWAYVDGRWDDALAAADELIAGADARDRDYRRCRSRHRACGRARARRRSASASGRVLHANGGCACAREPRGSERAGLRDRRHGATNGWRPLLSIPDPGRGRLGLP
jgi:hypothetical protein